RRQRLHYRCCARGGCAHRRYRGAASGRGSARSLRHESAHVGRRRAPGSDLSAERPLRNDRARSLCLDRKIVRSPTDPCRVETQGGGVEMKPRLWKLRAAAAVVGLLAAAPPAQAADPIKIVALYNLSAGGLASIDGPSLNGPKLKAKEINDAGGLL